MTNRLMKDILLFSVVIIVLAGLVLLKNLNAASNSGLVELQYYEDPSGQMGLEEIQEKSSLGMFSANRQELFSFGKSSSTYWIRIPLAEKDPDFYKEYISIYNPTVARTALYLPVKDKDTLAYKKYFSGWRFRENKQDEGFTYPVFSWDENTDFTRDAYLQLHSCFTQNYRITFLSANELEQIKRNDFLLHGILFGILLAVAIQSLLIFTELRNKAYLYFFLYIVLMMFYQGNLAGIYNVFIPRYADVIMANTIVFSLITMSAVILFFQRFFKTKEFFPAYDQVLRWLFGLVLGGIFLAVYQPAIGNLYAHTIANVGSVFMIFVAYKAYRQGFEQARLFLLGWFFMIISLVISILRYSGWIPNNIITVNITFIAVAVQSILLLAALVKMIKILTEEKEEAQENAYSKEMAFLHAQIRPHFLYNTLNVIINLCRIDPEKARELLLDFSDFLRYSFDFSEAQKLVCLQDELEYVQAYVRIEEARFKNKLQVIYEMDETAALKIPPLILQPLVENAVIHGVKKRKGTGRIVLRVEEDNDVFRVEVEDNGVGMTREQIDAMLSDKRPKGRGVGIANINKRLHKYYGQGLNIESVPEQGTLVYFKVPKEGGLLPC